MAMTKAEKELVESLKLQLALSFGDGPVLPDVPIPTESLVLSVGYIPIGVMGDYPRVVEACSGVISHGTDTQVRTNTQSGIPLYSTRSRALRALRYLVAMACAAKLRQIDVMIEQELDGGAS